MPLPADRPDDEHLTTASAAADDVDQVGDDDEGDEVEGFMDISLPRIGSPIVIMKPPTGPPSTNPGPAGPDTTTVPTRPSTPPGPVIF